MNKNKILEDMRRLKIIETIKIIERGLDKDVAKSELEKFLKNNKVDVKYIGKMQLDGKWKDMYKVLEIYETKQNGEIKINEIEKYMTDDLEYVAGDNKNDLYNKLFLTEKYAKNPEILKELEQMDREGIFDLDEMENERTKNIAQALGISVDEIEDIDEMNLDQLVEKDGDKNKGEKEEQNDDKNKDEEEQELTEEQVEHLNIKEETHLNQNIKGESLGDKLGLKKSGINDGVKLARVSTTGVNQYLDVPTSQADAFVVIRSNGDAVLLGENILQQDNRAGTNPTNSNLSINNDGSVKKESITSSYRIVNGNGKEYIRTGYDESSGKEIKYSMFSPQEGEYVDIELETQRTMLQDSDVRQFMKDKGAGTREAENIIEKGEVHEAYGELEEDRGNTKRDVDVKDVDNDKNNNTHEHIEQQVEDKKMSEEHTAQLYVPDTNKTWKEFATDCGYRGDGWLEKITQKWENERNREKNDMKSNQELVDEIITEIEEEYMQSIERK